MEHKNTLDNTKYDFPFRKKNYTMMIVGVVLIALGFVLMAGGGSDDPAKFSDAIFDFRRLTLAPILVLAGFGVELIAVMSKSKE